MVPTCVTKSPILHRVPLLRHDEILTHSALSFGSAFCDVVSGRTVFEHGRFFGAHRLAPQVKLDGYRKTCVYRRLGNLRLWRLKSGNTWDNSCSLHLPFVPGSPIHRHGQEGTRNVCFASYMSRWQGHRVRETCRGYGSNKTAHRYVCFFLVASTCLLSF